MARKKKEEVKEEEVKTSAKKGRGKKKVEEAAPVKEVKSKSKEKAGKDKTKSKKEEINDRFAGKRGRKKGQRSVITKKDAEKVASEFAEIESFFDTVAEDVQNFLDKNAKSSVGKARKSLQEVVKRIKPFRKTLQEAKANMKEEKV